MDMYDKEGKGLCCYVIKPTVMSPDLPNRKIITDDLCVIGESKVWKRIFAYKNAMQEILKRFHKHFKAG